jgi:hypothetical protein
MIPPERPIISLVLLYEANIRKNLSVQGLDFKYYYSRDES